MRQRRTPEELAEYRRELLKKAETKARLAKFRLYGPLADKAVRTRNAMISMANSIREIPELLALSEALEGAAEGLISDMDKYFGKENPDEN